MPKQSLLTNVLMRLLVLLIAGLVTSCYKPNSEAYRSLYAHLNTPLPPAYPVNKHPQSDYFVVFFVDARHLDYTENYSFLNTLAKHPSDGSKNRDVGHAWIYLEGVIDGQRTLIEGGHSGECGITQAKYFDGIMNYIDYGYANPTKQQRLHPRYEPNPVKYLWETLYDGFFQPGSGRHRPTFAARVDLTLEQYGRIMKFVQTYNYREYAITGNQCSSFVMKVAALAGLDLECEITMPINSSICLGGRNWQLWRDPCYAELTISSPDIIEKSLIQAVVEGKAVRVGAF